MGGPDSARCSGSSTALGEEVAAFGIRVAHRLWREHHGTTWPGKAGKGREGCHGGGKDLGNALRF